MTAFVALLAFGEVQVQVQVQDQDQGQVRGSETPGHERDMCVEFFRRTCNKDLFRSETCIQFYPFVHIMNPFDILSKRQKNEKKSQIFNSVAVIVQSPRAPPLILHVLLPLTDL